MKITDETIRKICSSTIYKRGMDYFKEGRVHIRKREEDSINAMVDGEQIYYVQVKFKNDSVSDCMCTCPYYQTMQSACKHIVAVMKQRKTELDEGDGFIDENDRIAANLCRCFESTSNQRERLPVKFCIRASTQDNRRCIYTVELKLGPDMVSVPIYRFLNAYITGEKYRIESGLTYSSDKYCFSAADRQVLDRLAEIYQNISAVSPLCANYTTQMTVGDYSIRHIFGILEKLDFEFSVNSVLYSEMRICDENPDILVDVSVENDIIHICVSESGIALTDDGSFFFYEGDLYRTEFNWQSWFMPIYNSLLSECRTQIRFKGTNAVNFASVVLPMIKNRHGVVCHGLEESVVNEKPKFEVYFDKYKNGIAAVVKAVYGGISFRIPSGPTNDGKIVVRDIEAENTVLDFFKHFEFNDNVYCLENNDILYDFISENMRELSAYAKIYYSDAFKDIRTERKIDFKSRIAYNEHLDFLETSFETNLTAEEIYGILSAMRLKKKFYRLNDGAFLTLDDDNITEVLKLIEHIGLNNTDIDASYKRIAKNNIMFMLGLENGLNPNIVLDQSFIALRDKIKNIKADIPPELENILREYQKTGVHWLKQLADMGFGGILADDMGLGKTVQVIAFVAAEKYSEPSLIVAPSALVYNWQSEILKFSPGSSVLIIDGTKDERSEKISDCSDYDFIITSYPLLRRDIDLYKPLHFSCCFIDEAQYIKNANTMNARSVKKINADKRFALTGTPIENSLGELWSIFDFVMPKFLGTGNEFATRYERPAVKDENTDVLTNLKYRIKPFILRRMKKDVLAELPEKMENTMLSDLEDEQKKMYAAFVAQAKNEVIGLEKSGEYSKNKLRILALLMRLRQICCHPALFDEHYKKDSGKLLMLEELLNTAISGGHRVLVFSQFTSMLEIIKKRLDKLKISYFCLDGSTPAQERTILANRFNDGEGDVFLISLKAGGTGLNLIGADTVIHYDPWWNPAVMDQASDRAYRIGQKKSVQVIKLAARGTIEEKIIQLQERKRSLADGIITVNQTMLSSLTKDEILSLLD